MVAQVLLHEGDCRDVLSELAENSVDAIVTDPPYDLTAHGRAPARPAPLGEGDRGTEAYPRGSGGFMGERWDATGIAFDARTWEACRRVLKPGGHLAAFGAPRTYHRMVVAVEDAGFEIRDCIMWLYGTGFPKSMGRHTVGGSRVVEVDVTAPATDDAKRWEGWGTALKPAWEPILLARKPTIGSVANNVLVYGTGGLHVDAARVPFRDAADERETKAKNRHADFGTLNGGNQVYGQYRPTRRANYDPPGRWPANVAVDPVAARQLDRSVAGAARPSRFFYCAKTSRADRGAGNLHPSVKPVALMRWLVRLVAPPNGLILDPFAGSGTTLLACELEGLAAIGVEHQPEYTAFARSRLGLD